MHNGHPANWKQQTKQVLDGGLHHYISHTKMTPWNNRVVLDHCYLSIRVLLRISGIIKIAVLSIPTKLQSFFSCSCFSQPECRKLSTPVGTPALYSMSNSISVTFGFGWKDFSFFSWNTLPCLRRRQSKSGIVWHVPLQRTLNFARSWLF